MVGRSPARFLAPLALVGFAVALILVVGASSSSDPETEAPSTTVERRTSTADEAAKETEQPREAERTTTKTYTIQPGDTPSGIASAHGITTERLLELNSGLDPTALTVGEKVKVE